jgi:beta-fructofuranosidase
MALTLADRWLWDFWIVRDGPDYHVFYLQAPRALGDPELRHWHASIGHAVSVDLRRWEVLPDALGPGPPGAWDDFTTWTGSVFRDDGGWAMLYTGTSQGGRGLVQRIGLARSLDLVSWGRHPANPVLEADHQIYEALDLGIWHDEAWRDPWVFRLESSGPLYALITARAADGEPDRRGVVGLARGNSADRWEILPPITQPGPYGQLEIPQLVRLRDRWCLLFSVPPADGAAAADLGPRALGGTHFLLADAPLGPFEWSSHGVLLADATGTWYGAKLEEAPDGSLVCLAWLNHDSAGRFVGALSDPMPVEFGSGGPRVVHQEA